MSNIRGKAVKLYIGAQADIATRTAADGYHNTFMYSIRSGGDQDFEVDPILGGSFYNDRDATAPAPGLANSSVSLVAPSCMNHLGYWLTAALGAASISGTSPVLREYESGKDTLPFHTLAYELGTDDGRRITGFVPGSVAFTISKQAGFGRVQIDGAARKFEKPTDIDVGTVPSALALTRNPAYRGIFRVGGVAEASLLSCTATYNNNLDLVPYASDDEFVGDICPGDSSFTAQISVRYKNRYFADKGAEAFEASGLFATEFEWQKSATEKLLLAAPKMRVAPSSEEISGPGGIEVSYTLTAEQTTSAPMLTAALSNAVASGDYL